MTTKTNKLATIATIISAILLIWLGISFFEIISNNMTPDYVYSNWNLFKLFLGAR